MKKTNPPIIIMLVIILVFICAYYISNSGYYEYELKQKTLLTNEKIKEFEQDIKNNQNIDIKTYLDPEDTNYSNKLTNAIYQLSDKGNHLMRSGMKAIFKKLSALIDDD